MIVLGIELPCLRLTFGTVNRYILSYAGGGQLPIGEVRKLHSFSGIRILEQASHALFVAATPIAKSQLTTLLPRWRVTPLRKIQLEETRPRVRRHLRKSQNPGG
jgi:hypothetical protein